jgi:hypothetical protein
MRWVARVSMLGMLGGLALGAIGCGGPASNATPSSPVAPPAFTSMVVGTAHRGHLQVADYPLTKLDELLDAFRPDLVLVEIRPQPFAEGRLEDGPLEMSYVTVQARRRGVPVEPIDWYRDEDLGRETSEDPEARRAFEAEVGDKERETDSFAPFAVLNGAERARDFLTVENAGARFGLADNAQWHRRQSWFHRQALAAIEKRHAHRVAAFVGFAHRPELDAWLVTAGAASTSPARLLAEHPSRPTPAPPAGVTDEIVHVWQAGIERLRARAERADPTARRRLAAKIRYWEIAVERRGLCCVDDRAFAMP